jgi:hypothetical protein
MSGPLCSIATEYDLAFGPSSRAPKQIALSIQRNANRRLFEKGNGGKIAPNIIFILADNVG